MLWFESLIATQYILKKLYSHLERENTQILTHISFIEFLCIVHSNDLYICNLDGHAGVFKKCEGKKTNFLNDLNELEFNIYVAPT